MSNEKLGKALHQAIRERKSKKAISLAKQEDTKVDMFSEPERIHTIELVARYLDDIPACKVLKVCASKITDIFQREVGGFAAAFGLIKDKPKFVMKLLRKDVSPSTKFSGDELEFHGKSGRYFSLARLAALFHHDIVVNECLRKNITIDIALIVAIFRFAKPSLPALYQKLRSAALKQENYEKLLERISKDAMLRELGEELGKIYKELVTLGKYTENPETLKKLTLFATFDKLLVGVASVSSAITFFSRRASLVLESPTLQEERTHEPVSTSTKNQTVTYTDYCGASETIAERGQRFN